MGPHHLPQELLPRGSPLLQQRAEIQSSSVLVTVTMERDPSKDLPNWKGLGEVVGRGAGRGRDTGWVGAPCPSQTPKV